MGFEGLECLGLQVKALLPNPGLEFVAFMSSTDVAETVPELEFLGSFPWCMCVCVCVGGRLQAERVFRPCHLAL